MKHTILMTLEEYFAVKNYFVELNRQGKFKFDKSMQKFYKAFAIESSIKLDKKQNMFDNPEVEVMFHLEKNQTLLSTVGLFCREHAMDIKTIHPVTSRALEKIKIYIATELMDILGL